MNNNETAIMMENDFQDNLAMVNSLSQEVSSHDEVCSPHRIVGVDSTVVWDRHNSNNAQVTTKTPPFRKRSLSAGNVLQSHNLGAPQEKIFKRLSDVVIHRE